MLSITIQDIKKLEPNILDFGVDSFDDEMTEAAEEVTRDIRIRWWPTSAIGRYDISILGTAQSEMNADLLTNSQWTKCVALYCLGYMIFPKLSTFNSEQDIFERKFDYYRKEYSRIFDKILLDGVEYDQNSDGTIDNAEKEPTYYLRLKR